MRGAVATKGEGAGGGSPLVERAPLATVAEHEFFLGRASRDMRGEACYQYYFAVICAEKPSLLERNLPRFIAASERAGIVHSKPRKLLG